MSEPCIHDLPPAQCGTCLGFAEEHSRWERGATFEAAYEGNCADLGCRTPIEKRESIIKWADSGYTAYTHEGCRP